jgi:hypothetical protein
VVDAVHANQSGIFEFRSIISSIKLLLNFNSSFEVKLIKRKANLTAHTLGFFFFCENIMVITCFWRHNNFIGI